MTSTGAGGGVGNAGGVGGGERGESAGPSSQSPSAYLSGIGKGGICGLSGRKGRDIVDVHGGGVTRMGVGDVGDVLETVVTGGGELTVTCVSPIMSASR